MAERKRDEPTTGHTTGADGSTPGDSGETFKREGPEPGTGDTGRTVEEMNEKARDSVIRNVTPDEATD